MSPWIPVHYMYIHVQFIILIAIIITKFGYNKVLYIIVASEM